MYLSRKNAPVIVAVFEANVFPGQIIFCYFIWGTLSCHLVSVKMDIFG